MVNVRDLEDECAASIDRVRAMFKKDRDVRVTIAVRDANNPEAEFVLTSDELVCVVAMLERRRAAGSLT